MSKQEKQIGDYILEEEIGSGAFAKVVKGKHIPTGEQVAIKVLDKIFLNENVKTGVETTVTDSNSDNIKSGTEKPDTPRTSTSLPTGLQYKRNLLQSHQSNLQTRFLLKNLLC